MLDNLVSVFVIISNSYCDLLTSRCTASSFDPGGFVQSDWRVPWGGPQYVWPHRLKLEPAALRPGPIQTRSQQRKCKSTVGRREKAKLGKCSVSVAVRGMVKTQTESGQDPENILTMTTTMLKVFFNQRSVNPLRLALSRKLHTSPTYSSQ